MFQLLTQYFFTQKELNIPGIGFFILQTKNAIKSFGAQSLQAPGWTIVFDQASIGNNAGRDNALYNWLAIKLNSSTEDAALQFDDFCSYQKARIDRGEVVEWEGLGTLAQNEDSHIVFTPLSVATSSFTDVVAKKVTRENVAHNILVGEKETDTNAMQEQLGNTERRANTGRKLIWGILLIALLSLAVVLFKNGCSIQSIGNKQAIEMSKPGETYRLW